MSRSHRSARRHGRLLIECLVALVLLATAGLTLTASARALATLADDALLVAYAQSNAASLAEAALAHDCDSPTIAPAAFGARITTTAVDTRLAALAGRTVTVTLAPAPLSARDTQRLTLSAARSCP